MTRRNKKIGDWGEELACGFLRRKGYMVVERNYHATVGEIDIVAKHGGDFYFIEVKTREAGGMANDLSITPFKIMKLRKTIRHYCYHRNVQETGLVIAGLMVVYDRILKKINFRFAVFT